MTGAEAQVRSDAGRSVAAVLAFGLALGASAVVYPLLALDAGLPVVAIGLLTALSGASQLLSRLALPWLLERIEDRVLLVGACLCLGLSAGALVVDVSIATFVLAQLLQGLGRALFWTSSQTHVVRGGGIPLRRLAQVQTGSHAGSLSGPAIAGALLAWTPLAALGLIVGGAVAGGVVSALLGPRPRYPRRAGGGRRRELWRRPGVALGCWASFSAGGWRGMLDSYVPVLLVTAGLGSAAVGGLVALADGAVIAVTAWLARYGTERFQRLATVAGLAVAAGAAGLPLVAGHPVLAGLALVVAGGGAGIASSLGPAAVNAHAGVDEQGTALALAGTYRAGARFATPGLLAASSGVIGVPAAMVLAAVGIAAPMLVLGRPA